VLCWKKSEEDGGALQREHECKRIAKQRAQRTRGAQPWFLPLPPSSLVSPGSLFYKNMCREMGVDARVRYAQSDIIWIEHPLDGSKFARLFCCTLLKRCEK
jgi:hypothetical protein